jgi:hypothetical protein
MKPRKTLARSRAASLALAAGLLAALAGDHVRGQGAGVSEGIDPLDVLDLQVKPNVFIALDSSGSMNETVFGNTMRGDHPGSKMFQAKQVLTDVIRDNETKASFMFGQYTQSQNDFRNAGLQVGATTRPNRFLYHTQAWAPVPANPPTIPVALPAQGPGAYMLTSEQTVNLLKAYQMIAAAATFNNTQLYFQENGGPTCAVTVAPGTYPAAVAGNPAGSLALALTNAMNSCTGRQNTYTVTYTAGNRFQFASNAVAQFRLQWSIGTNSIRGVLNAGTADTGLGTSFTTANDPRINILDRQNTDDVTETYDPDGADPILGPSPVRAVTTYRMWAQKFWNGETLYVNNGTVCRVDQATAGSKTNPATFTVKTVSDCANPVGSVTGTVTWRWSGGIFGQSFCTGFTADVALRPCDVTSPTQLSTVQNFLRPEFPLNGDGSIVNYAENTEGTGVVTGTPTAGGITANGATPIAQSIDDIIVIWDALWNGTANPAIGGGVNAIKNHVNPKERTILLFVTDGDQNCDPFPLGNGTLGAPYAAGIVQSDGAALGAAAAAQKLYKPLAGTVNADGSINGDPFSSVQTYLIAFGNGAAKNRSDWIAWGGSGMVRPFGTFGGHDTWTSIPTQAERDKCKTCVDAFLVPDAATLRQVLSDVINQGAAVGEFTAQQSVSSNVFELVGQVPGASSANVFFDPAAPRSRYEAVVPNLFSSSFSLPNFDGQLRAFQNVGGTVQENWNAGTILATRVGSALQSCTDDGLAPADGLCTFLSVKTRIDRRIYTTNSNGVFPADVSANLTDVAWLTTNGNRVNLWPAIPVVAPATDATPGVFDAALGLPTTNTQADYDALQAQFQTCKGTNKVAGVTRLVENALSTHACSTANAITSRTQHARREAREMILAFMAGAQVARSSFDPDGAAGPLDPIDLPARVQNAGGELLYQARPKVLKDSTLATPVVVGPLPNFEPPTLFKDEYILFRDGFRIPPSGAGLGTATDGTLIGFGLKDPDLDDLTPAAPTLIPPGPPASGVDTRTNLKPSMTVLYVGANDMLHAFRGTTGEELWGFVPHDSLGQLAKHLAPPSRKNHVYMIAAGARFADVFVPNPGTATNPSGATLNKSVGGASKDIAGVWRRILVFGRGKGGRGLTALDVTTPGPYTLASSQVVPPVPLWSRGNPDTVDGTTGGALNHDQRDYDQYLKMGFTWSVPTIAFVDRAQHVTARKPSGVDFVVHVGSGYGDRSGCPAAPCEGTTFYTLDALTGDVVAAADLGERSDSPNAQYRNALVAGPADYQFENPATGGTITEFTAFQGPHPAAAKVVRTYIGDLHGRLWKFLSASAGNPVLFSDFGPDQPIAVSVAELGIATVTGGPKQPHVYVTTGKDNRADPSVTGQFGIFALRDEQADNDFSSPSVVQSCIPTVTLPCLFAREFETSFRGTVQPATIFQDPQETKGAVFFVGTRFNAPGTQFAPPKSATNPCRSSFDSIFYALGAFSGNAAYDLNSGSEDDAYVIFDNSKLQAISFVADTRAAGGGLALNLDEGLRAGNPPSAGQLPPGGLAPSTPGSGSVSGSVSMSLMRQGSTVCQ